MSEGNPSIDDVFYLKVCDDRHDYPHSNLFSLPAIDKLLFAPPSLFFAKEIPIPFPPHPDLLLFLPQECVPHSFHGFLLPDGEAPATPLCHLFLYLMSIQAFFPSDILLEFSPAAVPLLYQVTCGPFSISAFAGPSSPSPPFGRELRFRSRTCFPVPHFSVSLKHYLYLFLFFRSVVIFQKKTPLPPIPDGMQEPLTPWLASRPLMNCPTPLLSIPQPRSILLYDQVPCRLVLVC